MKDSALSAANFFVDLANDETERREPLTVLKLIKLVYIAHGFALALLDRTFLNPRFDWVEAWKYGPVIPSVYHSFKHYGKTPVDNHSVIFDWDKTPDEDNFLVEPELHDDELKRVCKFVWRRYKDLSDMEIVDLLHGAGTPWATVYSEGSNRIIFDELTRLYYKGLVRKIIEQSSNES